MVKPPDRYYGYYNTRTVSRKYEMTYLLLFFGRQCDRISMEEGKAMDMDTLGYFIFMDEQEKKAQQEEDDNDSGDDES